MREPRSDWTGVTNYHSKPRTTAAGTNGVSNVMKIKPVCRPRGSETQTPAGKSKLLVAAVLKSVRETGSDLGQTRD